MSSTKTPKKLSRREREENRVMRRALLIGGGVVGLAAAGGYGLMMMTPVFEALEGNGTIGERLEGAGVADHVVRLTPEIDDIDVLVIGTTDCIHCRNLVENGLDDLVAHGRKEGFGVAYAPIGYSATSLATTRLASCIPKSAVSDPTGAVHAVYAAAEDMKAGASFEDVTVDFTVKSGADIVGVEACLAEDETKATARMKALTEAFPIKGTPMIFVSRKDAPGKVNWFNGFSRASGLLRQVDSARSTS